MRTTPIDTDRPKTNTGGGEPASGSDLDLPVLIVDDDPGIRKTYTKMLERSGFSVQSVDSALAAFDVLQDRAYGVILCDIQMPGLTGPSFFEQLEERLPHLASRVVFLSGYVDQHETNEFLRRTGQPFLSKPSGRDELVATVTAVTQRAGRESGSFKGPRADQRPGER